MDAEIKKAQGKGRKRPPKQDPRRLLARNWRGRDPVIHNKEAQVHGIIPLTWAFVALPAKCPR